jgi:hypothetical protein
MAEDAVLNWDDIVHKNVRSKDGQDAGNVDAIEVHLAMHRLYLIQMRLQS